jgi:signal transduction histidine kinase
LELIVKRGRALVEGRIMVLLLHQGDELVVRAAAGAVGADLIGRRVPVEGSQSGAVLRGRQSRRLTDVQSSLRYGFADDLNATAGLLVPLIFHGRALGVLGAFDRLQGGPGFSAEDERLMDAFATSAATSVATAQSVAQLALRRSIEAAEIERSRWARELHDDTLQELAALKIALTSARRRKDPERVDEVLGESVTQLNATINDLRAIVTDLRPAALDVLGVRPALEALAERMQSRSNMAIELSVDLAYEAGRAATRLAPEIELTLYRLVQEAVTNAARHSGGTAIRVEVNEGEDCVVGAISDDGHGFDPNDASAGFGLLGMRERVALVDGTLDVQGGPEGTLVRFTLPVRRSAALEATPDGREA